MTGPFTNIVITGASGGLGQALARRLAAPGRVMLLAGRDPERLRAVAEAVADRGAAVEVCSKSLADRDVFQDQVRSFVERCPVDLVVANAGVKTGNADGLEPPGQSDRVIDVNLRGVITTVEAALPSMRRHRRGRIVIVSSLAAVSPQADLLSYSATKAAVRAYGTALGRNLHGSGVGVSVVMPGFVDTPMTDRHVGPTPMLVTADRAADAIVAGLVRGRREIVVPRTLGWLAALEALLPVPVADRIHQAFRAQILPDGDERSSGNS